MPKVEQVGRAAEGAVMTEGCGMWPVQTGLRMTFLGGVGVPPRVESKTEFWCYLQVLMTPPLTAPTNANFANPKKGFQ